ncbi:hypothetical protein JCM3770_000471 [Rhodotorula araucariae]
MPSMHDLPPVDASLTPPTVSTKRGAQTDSLSSPPAKRTRTTADAANPLHLKPLGNLMFAPEHRHTRANGLGSLAALPDELLLSSILTLLTGEDLVRMAAASRAFFAWSCVEGLWKGLYIQKTQGRLLKWHGSWRSSYIATFLRPASLADSDEPLPSTSISTPTLHSDVLFQPALCAAFDARTIFNTASFVPTIPRIPGVGVSPSTLPYEPVILTGLMDTWGAMKSSTSRRWTLPHLAVRFSTQLFRAEATLATLPAYAAYHDACAQDESPLYLFESEFVRKTEGAGGPSFGDDYEVPPCFGEDLFSVMGDERPDYRWLIVGPTRSGSTWHVDPNHTSAWNAVATGDKAWVMFPPDVTPPGVYASADGAHVEAPLSLAEWFLSYYPAAKAAYGARAKDPATRGKMREGICRAGEVLYVPSGWWHIVVNLSPAIAVTQNYVSHRELPAVLRFMRDRPAQVSGFKLRSGPVVEGGLDEDECDESGGGEVFARFVSALRARGGDTATMLDTALSEIGGEERRVRSELEEGEKAKRRGAGGMWRALKEEQAEEEGEGGFSFGFGLDEGDFEEDEDGEAAGLGGGAA